jgi:SAM-dependent methyltransferase
MDEETARALNQLNLAFYREHAAEFSATRERPWPGWRRILPHLPPSPSLRVLDVGCGNGRFARYLAEQRPDAHYTGVDASGPLLEEAGSRMPELAWTLHRSDFVADPPDEALPPGPFELVALFGVLHTVPGHARRRALVEACAARLAAGGILALAGWRFAEHDDLRRRILPWQTLAERGGPALSAEDLEPGDHLLGWGDGGALRYAHALDAEALRALCAGLPVEPVDAYVDDGRDRSRNRYVLLRASGPPDAGRRPA